MIKCRVYNLHIVIMFEGLNPFHKMMKMLSDVMHRPSAEESSMSEGGGSSSSSLGTSHDMARNIDSAEETAGTKIVTGRDNSSVSKEVNQVKVATQHELQMAQEVSNEHTREVEGRVREKQKIVEKQEAHEEKQEKENNPLPSQDFKIQGIIAALDEISGQIDPTPTTQDAAKLAMVDAERQAAEKRQSEDMGRDPSKHND